MVHSKGEISNQRLFETLAEWERVLDSPDIRNVYPLAPS